MTNAAPAHVSNMNKSVYTSKVNKYSVRSNILNCSFKNLTFFKLRNNLLSASSPLLTHGLFSSSMC